MAHSYNSVHNEMSEIQINNDTTFIHKAPPIAAHPDGFDHEQYNAGIKADIKH